MVKLYFNPSYKYTNRTLIDVSNDSDFIELDYENIDSQDTINGHIIYEQEEGLSRLPTYLVQANGWRWFVSGITQLRTGKFQISLLRDIASESPETWSKQSAYIEAGTATDFCKYKKWGLPFTNTKVGQQRLPIGGGKSSFFVFYTNERNVGGGGAVTENDFTVQYSTAPKVSSYDIAVNNLNEVPHYNFVNSGFINCWEKSAGTLRLLNQKSTGLFGLQTQNDIAIIDYDSIENPNNFHLNTNFYYGNFPEEIDDFLRAAGLAVDFAFDYQNNIGNIKSHTSGAIASFLETYQNNNYGSTQPKAYFDELDGYIDKVIRVGSGSPYKFYKIKKDRVVVPHEDWIPANQTSSLLTVLRQNSIFNSYAPFYTVGESYFLFRSVLSKSQYTLEYLGEGDVFTYNFKSDVIKLPKSSVRCVNIVPDDDRDLSATLIMQTLMLSQSNPDVDANQNIGRIIDIQYLPFSIATQQNANFTLGGKNLIAEFLSTDDYLYTHQFTTLSSVNKETDSIVIVSPSRKSQFKFSPYNTDGKLIFDTKITIRPNQSIIYVRPTTQGLLMYDWDDKECLIIQEDFSLTAISSAWTNYVYNNRNYQNAFNLQIQTKEFERTWERRIEQEQAKADTWTARNISAQKASTYTGNLPLISNMASAFGTAFQDTTYMQMAQLDREYNEALYQKSLEVARTQFSYQIENIKSQPLIPNTITAIDIKMLDGIYLEYYSTNITEQQSISNFYKYNGNRIENYGNFATYWGPFIRGRIIISQNYTQPEIDELNRRLELGLFTGGY